MLKVAILVWIVLGATLAGSLILAVLLVPSLQLEAMKWVLYAAVGGFVIALPLSWIIAGKISASMKG
jgi:hypothetical protein